MIGPEAGPDSERRASHPALPLDAASFMENAVPGKYPDAEAGHDVSRHREDRKARDTEPCR